MQISSCFFLIHQNSLIILLYSKNRTNPMSIKRFVQNNQLSTNQVLIERQSGKQFYYLPCYIRLKVKSVAGWQIQNLVGTICGDLLISIYYGSLDKTIVAQFLSVQKIGDQNKQFQFVKLSFAKDETISLNNQGPIAIKNIEEEQRFQITIRRSFICRLEGELFLSPFEIINLYLSVTVHSVSLNPAYNKNKKIKINFNNMDTKQFRRVDHTKHCYFGQYNIAPSLLEVQYSNNSDIFVQPQQNKEEIQSQNQIDKGAIETVRNIIDTNQVFSLSKKVKESENLPKCFQYAHYRIPFYKNPLNSLSTVFLPLFVLELITLSVFFQGPNLGSALQTLSTLMLAFIAFIPTIRQQIPPHSSILAIEVLIFVHMLPCFFALLRIFLIRNEDQNAFVYDFSTDGLFFAALTTNFLTFVIVISLHLVHKFVWEPAYLQVKEGKKSKILIRQIWENLLCDDQFAKFKEIKPLSQKDSKQVLQARMSLPEKLTN